LTMSRRMVMMMTMALLVLMTRDGGVIAVDDEPQ
jgi:hypothetical protein